MQCLMCRKELGGGSLKDIFEGNDPLCESCRKMWEKKKIMFEMDGVRVCSDYVYNKAFSSCLIQYKECGDEALKDVFLFEIKNKLKRRYHGYTLLLMPSTEEKVNERGFYHLEKMYACLGLKMVNVFQKKTAMSQKKMTASMRKHMEHEIVLKENIQLDKKLLLVDDTITTGSTLKGALSCLNKNAHQIEIYCVSANHSWLK